VARIGTHLFHFVEFAQNMRGYGRVLKNAIGNWYLEMPVERLVEQLIKYRQRDGWTHADLLRLSHPKFQESGSGEMAKVAQQKQALVQWTLKGLTQLPLPERLQAHVDLQNTTAVETAARIIQQHGLTWESVPTE